ncbi:hypothetical protein JDO7802_00999 [Jannaschia donghaensis]|uniref:Uncharacterized protein n=1 Tax=Jannaschia donghaensis TaxID=420998 RepID=A0A0M6YF59_9RHOB|nr:hypothetical protein JDO7802_00999 [Jannaschia donghaensis]
MATTQEFSNDRVLVCPGCTCFLCKTSVSLTSTGPHVYRVGAFLFRAAHRIAALKISETPGSRSSFRERAKETYFFRSAKTRPFGRISVIADSEKIPGPVRSGWMTHIPLINIYLSPATTKAAPPRSWRRQRRLGPSRSVFPDLARFPSRSGGDIARSAVQVKKTCQDAPTSWHREHERPTGVPRAFGDAAAPVRRAGQTCRSIIIFLIFAIALAGFRPLGQDLAQFMIVWQR